MQFNKKLNLEHILKYVYILMFVLYLLLIFNLNLDIFFTTLCIIFTIPLFSKISSENVFENETRRKIYDTTELKSAISLNDLRRILLNFEYGSLISLEKFFELEGSFVRESSIVPIVVEKLIEKHRKEDVVELEVEKFSQLTIPISINFLFKLEPEKMIALSEGKLVIQDVSPRFFKYHGVFVRNMVRNNIQAFIVPAKYSEEKGLTIGGEDE